VDFGLSQEQLLLKSTLRRYLDAECPTSRVRAVMEGPDGHDPELWRGLASLGVTGMIVPPEQGGAGLELLDLALAAEELGWAAAPGPFLATALGTVAILASGDRAAAERWLPPIAEGTSIVTAAVGEGLGEWDADQLKTRAESDRLTGEKSLVPYAALADAIAVAAVDRDGAGLWLVERGAPGLEISPLSGNDMTRRVDRVRLSATPATRLASGRAAIDRTRDAGLVLLAADAWAGARRCHHMTTEYAKTRVQFGQPIGAFQGVKHQLADLIADLEPALSLWWYAAHAFDRVPAASERHAALAKAHLADLFDRAARTSIELHGGIGYTWEYDLQLWFRRAMFDRAFLGESSYHRRRAADLAGW
jgi:alkylation response protein AidB-like acyl-CoA dehydrogenase